MHFFTFSAFNNVDETIKIKQIQVQSAYECFELEVHQRNFDHFGIVENMQKSIDIMTLKVQGNPAAKGIYLITIKLKLDNQQEQLVKVRFAVIDSLASESNDLILNEEIGKNKHFKNLRLRCNLQEEPTIITNSYSVSPQLQVTKLMHENQRLCNNTLI